MHYSPSRHAFFLAGLHPDMPADAVEISNELHQALMQAQSEGKRIEPGPDGLPVAVDPPPPSAELNKAVLTHHVQRHLDAEARALGYDSIATAVTYADEPAVAEWQEQGIAFREWRSRVWAAAFAALEQQPLPSPQELIALLPTSPVLP